jgi:hypothetical protein
VVARAQYFVQSWHLGEDFPLGDQVVLRGQLNVLDETGARIGGGVEKSLEPLFRRSEVLGLGGTCGIYTKLIPSRKGRTNVNNFFEFFGFLFYFLIL